MISVVVPVYNVEKYIINCLKSIVHQDYADFELILVNDGSTDNSVSIIEKTLKDTNVNWKIINKENGGQSSAKNLGFKESKGDYVVFMDSDDVVTSDFLSSLLNAIQNNDVDFSFCNFKYVKQQSIELDSNDELRLFSRNELLEYFLKRKINFVLPSMMFKRKFLIDNNIYSNENIRFSEDQMFIWDAIFASSKSIYLYKKMYGYYLREKSIMTSSPYNKIMKGYEEYVLFIERLLNKYPNDKKLINMILPRWELGTLYTAANLVTKDEFTSMYQIMDGKNILNKIVNMHDKNSYLLAIASKISVSLLYKLCRKLNLNE